MMTHEEEKSVVPANTLTHRSVGLWLLCLVAVGHFVGFLILGKPLSEILVLMTVSGLVSTAIVLLLVRMGFGKM